MARVLVVDDELGVRESLRMLLKEECEVATAESVDQALEALAEAPADLVLLDLVMPGRSGLELLAELRAQGEAPPVVVLTATRTVATAVEAMKLGAEDYLTKPFEVDALRIKLRRLLERRALEERVARLEGELEERTRLGGLLGRSDSMREVFRRIEKLARNDATVLIEGESGTGKELVARAIHDLGERSEQPFVAVNCAAMPDNLIEDELFGHERGAFTGADARRVGRFEAAGRGTLFLDEIGELAPAVQAKLLRALQERVIEPLGGGAPVPVEARILAATHRDLEREVEAGRFRSDLFFRIHVVPLPMPPLRERAGDLRLLAEHFLGAAAERSGQAPRRLTREAASALERYAWPGNVRELQNAMERAVALADGPEIRLEDLPEALVRATRDEGLRERVRQGRMSLEEASEAFERGLLEEALDRCGWNQTRAAAELGITRRLLKLRMDRYALVEPAGPGSS